MLSFMQPNQNQNQFQNQNRNQNPNPNQNNQDQQIINLASKINSLNNFDFKNTKGLIKQSLKDTLGLNFRKINAKIFNTSNYNINSIEKLYFLSKNLRDDLENSSQNNQNNINEYLTRTGYNPQKLDRVISNVMSHEKDYYTNFSQLSGNLNNNNNSNELKKSNLNSPFNYNQENSNFEITMNKLGIFSLLQKNLYPKLTNQYKYRKMKLRQERLGGQNQKKLKEINSRVSGQNINISIMNSSRISTNKNNISINSTQLKKNYLVEEESNLFEKYLYSFGPYFQELKKNKNSNFNDKIIRIGEVLDNNIKIFKEGRQNISELFRILIFPSNNLNDKDNYLTTYKLTERTINFLESDFVKKNFNPGSNNNQNKEDFISNYTNNFIYTHLPEISSNSRNNTFILWGKIFFFLRCGWKKDCIKFIEKIQGLYINENGLNEIKNSLDDSVPLNPIDYNEFKRILNQEKKEDNPFKHACMVYMTKIPDSLYDNILLEISDHLWFNLNLIFMKENYKNLTDNNGISLQLIKLRDLQVFFENSKNQIIMNDKYTNFTYIIFLMNLLKFKSAIDFMISNNMYIDAINYFFILKQLGLYNDFNEITDEKIVPSDFDYGEKIFPIYPKVSQNIPALILYIIFSFSDKNFIPALSYLLVETENFVLLDNYKIGNILINLNGNIRLNDLISEDQMKIICKDIFEKIIKTNVRNNQNLIPLFSIFRDMKMLTELVGLLIKESIELINQKKPAILNGLNDYNSSLYDQRYFNVNLINNYLGGFINDANKLYIEKQNELDSLQKNIPQNNINTEDINQKINLTLKEIEENEIYMSILKQLPSIENIYNYIYMNKCEEALNLFLNDVPFVTVGFGQNFSKVDYMKFIDDTLSKIKYGFLKLYPDILFIFIRLLRFVLSQNKTKVNIRNFFYSMKNDIYNLETLLGCLNNYAGDSFLEIKPNLERVKTELSETLSLYQ